MFNLIRTGVLIAALTALFMVVGYFIGGQTGIFVAFLVTAGTNLFAYWNADKMVLSMQGAVEVDPSRAPDLYRMVETLSQRAGIPTPKLYVIETPQPNAFATGRNRENAAVAVSSGLLNTLSRDEVGGVIAHELAHIKNHDTLIMTITATIAGPSSRIITAIVSATSIDMAARTSIRRPENGRCSAMRSSVSLSNVRSGSMSAALSNTSTLVEPPITSSASTSAASPVPRSTRVKATINVTIASASTVTR